MTVRRSLTAIIAVMALALAAACTQAPPAPTPAATKAPGTGATPAAGTPKAAATPAPNVQQRLTVGLTGVGNDGDLLNPTFPFGHWKFPVSQVLVDFHNSTDPRPQLAESFRLANPTTWEFTLRDARFANGDPVTAQDVAFSFTRALNPQNGYGVLLVTGPTIASVEAADAKTVRINTRGPDPTLPNRLAVFPIIQQKYFEGRTLEQYKDNPMGSGPYKVERFQARQEVVIVPSEAYVGTAPRNITRITFKEVPEQAARLAALESGEIDIMAEVAIQNRDRLRAINASSQTTPPSGVNYLSFDMREPQFAPRQVRLALNHAVDRRAIIDALYGGLAQPANQFGYQGSFGYVPELPQFEFNVNRARQLMAEGGFPNGFATPLAYNPATAGNQQLAEALTPMFAAIGVRVELQPGDPSTYLQRILANQVGPFYISQFAQGSLQDPAGFLNLLLSEPPGNGRYRNPQYDQLYQQQVAELDRTRRGQILQQMARVTHEDPAGVFLWAASGGLWGISPKVGGFDRVPVSALPQWGQMQRLRD